MKILIIEDEPKTTAYLKKGLAESGFIVDLASNGEDGFHLALDNAYDVIVSDIMLPRMDGLSVLSRLRERGVATSVLLLTARDSVPDRVRGLELGADDYLVKPFAFSELLARIRTILRRSSRRPVDTYVVGDIEIDPARHRVTRAGKQINLTPKEFTLLSLLARRAGEVLSRTIIAEQVWDLNFDSDTNVVDVAIRRLRQKVDDPFERKLIHTVRGVGYVLKE
jgi:two-component system copper resistance phosphate regulon response regulator CusR